MKYNVKQAVSGIQNELDQANTSRALGLGLQGLMGMMQAKQSQNQLDSVLAGLVEQRKDFQKIMEDPASSKIEKTLAKGNLLKLDFFKSGLNINNVSNYTQGYKDIMGNKNLFSDLAGIEKAKIYANRPLPPVFTYPGASYGSGNNIGLPLDNEEIIKLVIEDIKENEGL